MVETAFQTQAFDQAEKIMHQCLQTRNPGRLIGEAAEIGAALAPFRPASALGILPICLDQSPRDTVPLAVALAEKFPFRARQVQNALQGSSANELAGSAIISAVLGNLDTARSAMMNLVGGGSPVDALRIARSLAEIDPASSLTAMLRSIQDRSVFDYPSLYTIDIVPVAIKLARRYPAEAAGVSEKLFNADFPATAALIDIELGKKEHASALAAILVNKWLNPEQITRSASRADIDDKIGAIAARLGQLGDLQPLKSCIDRYFKTGQIGEIYGLAAELAFLDHAEGQAVRSKLLLENLFSPNDPIGIKQGTLPISAALGHLEFTSRMIDQMVQSGTSIRTETALMLIRRASD